MPSKLTRHTAVALVFALCCFAAKPASRIISGSKIFIVPCGGFEVSLTAGLEAKHVPLIIVVIIYLTDKRIPERI